MQHNLIKYGVPKTCKSFNVNFIIEMSSFKLRLYEGTLGLHNSCIILWGCELRINLTLKITTYKEYSGTASLKAGSSRTYSL